MSHTSTISAIKIVSIPALQQAVARLAADGIKCSLISDAKPRAYFENQQGMGKADYVLKVDEAAYDVGFYKTEDGSYEARTDWFGGTVERILGATPSKPENREQARLGKLFQNYALYKAKEEAKRKGYMTREIVKGGKIMLEVTGGSL